MVVLEVRRFEGFDVVCTKEFDCERIRPQNLVNVLADYLNLVLESADWVSVHLYHVDLVLPYLGKSYWIVCVLSSKPVVVNFVGCVN